ncbi:ATP-grasp domain-containing protein [Lentibacillus salicampi]|nr:ATP-grasp domain-containing protein [Lentibacillus salicampi]
MLSTYSIILEAWRRGLEINISIVLEKSGKIEPYYSISNGTKTHHFSTTRGDGVTEETKELAKNKWTAKEYLKKNNVPTPDGKEFSENVTNAEIIQYANNISYPLVIKPTDGTGGRGVIGNIQNEKELKEALNYVREKLNYPKVILEKYFEGSDYRLYVLNNKVIGALKRVRSHVIGNGKDTIKQLINKKNQERSKLPSLTNRPIKIDDETKTLLKRKNYSLDSVAKDGEIVYLKSKNNVSAGGDSIDITDQVPQNIKNIAIEAANSFPSLPQCGVDMIVDEKNNTGVVIELNSRAHITQHLFPMEGQARDIPSHIIDYYFPETKDYNRKEANKLYIDYDFIYDSCLASAAKDITLPKLPSSPIILKRFLLSNCEYNKKLANRIKRTAFNKKVSGYIKALANGDIVIIAAGNKKNVGEFEDRFKKYVAKNFSAPKITEKNRTSPVKHGFHIEEIPEKEAMGTNSNVEEYIQKYSNLRKDYQRLVRQLAEYEEKEKIRELTNKQNKQLKKQLKRMEASTSWKVTKPLRKFTDKVRGK